MKTVVSGSVLVLAMLLAGCHAAPSEGVLSSHHGRYVGIGIYSADAMWSKIVADDQPGSPKAATTADDRDVIVVVDSDTGEIRQCGNLSGFCVRMNPWTQSLPQSHAAPMHVAMHAAELDRAESDTADDLNSAAVNAN